ncbi:MAG: EboA family metabolite traffic protein [Cyanobacteria bacterium J06639_14]
MYAIEKMLHPDRVPHNFNKIVSQLQTWLIKQLEVSSLDWLNQVIQQLSKQPSIYASERTLLMGFSRVTRRVSKATLALTEADLQAAHKLRASWNPEGWSVDQAVRTFMILSFPTDDADRYVTAIETLFSAANVAEQIALYQSLPLLPYPERFKARTIEGLRSNMTSVFNAIALKNPYPADYFDEAAWNQMVLKALFVDSHLSQIQGLDARANPKLAQMLSDYAHERWAAGRAVNPQLWRPMGPFAKGLLIADLERVLDSPERFEQQAAALACDLSPAPEAQALLDKVPTLKQQIADKQLTWDSFSLTHP